MMFFTSISLPEFHLLCLNNIPLCVCTHTYIYTYILYMYHIFLIFSSVVGHLGYFHSLAVLHNAVVNMGVQVCLLYLDVHSFEMYAQE
jgi:hypothetical protein